MPERPPPAAFAASCTDSWENAAGGSWMVGSNWSSGSVPSSGDDVCIEVAGSYTVTLASSVSVRSLMVGNGSNSGTQSLLVTSAGGASPSLSLAGDSSIGVSGQLELDSPVSEPSVQLVAVSTATVTDDGDLLVAGDGGPADYLRAVKGKVAGLAFEKR